MIDTITLWLRAQHRRWHDWRHGPACAWCGVHMPPGGTVTYFSNEIYHPRCYNEHIATNAPMADEMVAVDRAALREAMERVK